MISDEKTRVTATIPKEQEQELEKYCKRTNMTKSTAISLALATLFYTGYKVGDIIGQMVIGETREEEQDNE